MQLVGYDVTLGRKKFALFFMNAASLNNLLLLKGFPKRLKLEGGSSYLDEPNSTSFIDTTHGTLVKAVCIYAGYSHIKN